MNKNFLTKIILPKGQVYEGQVNMAIMPGEEGQFAVLAGHERLFANLMIGEVILHENLGTICKIFIYKGIAIIDDVGLNVISDFAYNLQNISLDDVSTKISALQHKKDFINGSVANRQKTSDIKAIDDIIKRYNTLSEFIKNN